MFGLCFVLEASQGKENSTDDAQESPPTDKIVPESPPVTKNSSAEQNAVPTSQPTPPDVKESRVEVPSNADASDQDSQGTMTTTMMTELILEY